MSDKQRMRIVVAGGGAAGFFAAITCAQRVPDADVILLEKSPELLAKVAISGGGRCNVTHACFDVDRLITFYPRGDPELIGPFHRWQPRDTVDWFQSRGVPLKTEADGRMFPVSDKSSSITDCLVREAKRAGVVIHDRKGLVAAVRRNGRTGFLLTLSDKQTIECERLLLATGGNQDSVGFKIAAALGHTIEPPVPSLFTFNIKDARLDGLAGISVPDAQITAPAQRLVNVGPILITHWGLSGPAILRLSAWGAREFAECDYRFDLHVMWARMPRAAMLEEFHNQRAKYPARKVIGAGLFEIPNRLWTSSARYAGVPDDATWGRISKERMHRLSMELTSSRFLVEGKSLFKEEFVTCGGVNLREVDFRTMESRICPGLYFAGEVLDIDGVTGGFNLQSAWTTGWIAGESMGQVLRK
jgi:predicted Rossmann fold flavoprotein